MATTVAARKLTEAHRLAQLRVGTDTVAQMLAAWKALDPSDIDGTLAQWLTVVRPLIQRQRSTSTTLAANYYQRFRTLELPGTKAFTPVLAAEAPAEQIATTMLVTGPAQLRAASARGVALDTAIDHARTSAAGTAMRLALGGGRDTLAGNVVADQRAIGWARVTSGNPCAFCAMVASRGPIYTEDTVDFETHASCACSIEPVYREAGRDSWPPGSAQYAELWNESTSGEADQLNAFRRALSAQ